MHLSRRGMLAGAASFCATGVFAQAPARSLRPIARQVGVRPAAAMLAQSKLSGDVSVVLADVASGAIIDAAFPDVALPPASVTKSVTALYAIENLGSGFRFQTRILATGPIKDGVLDGDLILAGGGDPNLVTGQLAELAASLKETGIRDVTGDFLVWDNALVNLDEIDDTQLDYLGYNPAVTGLNLNFNRVHFEWKRAGAQYTIALDARDENYRPVVTTARMQIVDRNAPVFTYRDIADVDEWTVARGALGNGGSRWLPVRHPALYAGEVFATFARSQGLVLKRPKEIADLPDSQALVTHHSDPLQDMMRGMLRYSTNITAEAAGLTATVARTGQMRGLRTSALGMTRWVAGRGGDIAPQFVDHSGLGDASRVSAGDMVKLLVADGVRPVLYPIMKPIVVLDGNRRALPSEMGTVHAKTGTLNFVSSLAGYIRTRSGRDLAFAFFGADLAAREQGKLSGDESPRGARSWNAAAKGVQQQMLRNWMTSI